MINICHMNLDDQIKSIVIPFIHPSLIRQFTGEVRQKVVGILMIHDSRKIQVDARVQENTFRGSHLKTYRKMDEK